MPRHPHEPVTPTLPFPPFPPAPPCGCRPPRMRPEPFSPSGLPAPHGFDFGRWAREKISWLLSLVPSAASADNPLADREWVTGQAVSGKADKVAGATEGNLAALTQDGNLADSGTKPDDFVGKAALFDNPDTSPTVKSSLLPSYVDDVVEYASLSAFPQPGETGKIYVALNTNIQYRWSGTQYTEIAKIIIPSTSAPLVDGSASAGSSEAYSRGDHRHPTDTSRASVADATLTEARSYPALATYTLPAAALPVTYNGTPPQGWDADAVSLTYDAEDEIVILDVGSYLAGGFDPATGVFKDGNRNLRFGGDAPVIGESPVIDIVPGAGYVLGSQFGKLLASEAEAEALRQGKQDALTFDNAPTSGSDNPVKSSGIWSALWGALSALPAGFSSLYDWCVNQLAGKLNNTTDTMSGSLTVSDTLTVGSRERGSTIGTKSTAEGINTTASGDFSHAEGSNTTAQNLAEHAQGRGNASHKASDDFGNAGNTLSSIGFSTRTSGRRNAVETMQDGKTFIYGLGGYDGTNPTSATDLAAAVNTKANDNAVVKLTGAQDIDGIKTFTDQSWFRDLMVAHPQGQGYIRIYALANENRIRIEFSDEVTGSNGELLLPVLGGYGGGTLAVIENIAPDAFGVLYDGATVDLNTLSCYQGILYRCILGYTFASGDDYPPNDSTHWAPATVEDALAALRTALAGKADVSAIPYAIGTPTVIDTASSEVVEGETVNYGAATLANRTANIVQVTAATALDELRITFPAATSGKVRDFGLRVEIGTGSAALTAPALVPIAPTGETIKIENADRAIPALADGTATAKGVTLLYFSENAPGVFVVKGEQVEEVA